MIDGLWIVQFDAPQGHRGGVVVLTKGRALGGDSGFTYSGSYELNGDLLKAKVSVKNFDPAVPNVFGVRGNFDLVLEAKIQGDTIVGTGAVATAANARINVRLTRQDSLS